MIAGVRTLTVRHVTVYRYSRPVGLGEHRMMFRPRESHDLRLVRTRLDILPRPIHLRWLHDVFDNSVAIATFGGTAQLVVTWLLHVSGDPLAPAWYLLQAVTVALIAMGLMRETAPVKVGR